MQNSYPKYKISLPVGQGRRWIRLRKNKTEGRKFCWTFPMFLCSSCPFWDLRNFSKMGTKNKEWKYTANFTHICCNIPNSKQTLQRKFSIIYLNQNFIFANFLNLLDNCLISNPAFRSLFVNVPKTFLKIAYFMWEQCSSLFLFRKKFSSNCT